MPSDSIPTGIDRVAVVGAGTMGYGIGLSYALAGFDVALFDVEEGVLADAEEKIGGALDVFDDEGRITAAERRAVPERIAYETDLDAATADADLVTEAVTEDLDVKRTVFSELDESAPSEAILATNTSGLSITEIAAPVDDPSRVVGTHWFNPPHIVPLVEVVYGEATSETVAKTLTALLDGMGKTAVEVTKDVPGFIANRIQMAMCYEAFALLDSGVASAEDIDRAVAAGFGFRLPALGIFEKVDQSGLDVHRSVEEYLMPELDRGVEPNPVVTECVEGGDLGLKTGRGVYDWSDEDPRAVYERRDRELLRQLSAYDEFERRQCDR